MRSTSSEKHAFFVPPEGFAVGTAGLTPEGFAVGTAGLAPKGFAVGTAGLAPEGLAGGTVHFPPEEARHARQVLRLGPGDVVRVVDGAGQAFRARLDEVSKGAVRGTVVERLPAGPPPAARVTLAVGLVKLTARFEVLLEKAAELGVERIVPLVTERAERSRIRADRGRAILVAAMKQSGSARLCELEAPATLDEVLRRGRPDLGLMCHEAAAPEDGIRTRLAGLAPGSRVTVLVGPEGGFTDAEVARAVADGYLAVSLGPTRLRTETAGIAAAAVVLLQAR